MCRKYFTVSYDDGLEQDKKIIEILKKYGMGGTFNLNSGLFGSQGMIGRLGEIGLRYIPERTKQVDGFLWKYHKCNRLPEDEISQVYDGFEIAAHAYKHEFLPKLDYEALHEAISKDIKKLSEIQREPVVGFAFPNGATSEKVEKALANHHILYARTIKSSKNFRFPDNPLKLNPTCWHADKDVFRLLEKFMTAEPEEDMLFYMWGHGYELDYGTKRNNLERLERICDRVAGRDDIICCSNKEALMKIK